MIGILLAVVGCYALVAALVHLAHWISVGKKRVRKHYVLVAHDQHMNMEWFLRSFFAFSRRMGTDVKLTVVDEGSTDQTTDIVERLGHRGVGATVYVGDEGGSKSQNDRKRSQMDDEDAERLLWKLQSEGIITSSDHAVLVDLQNPSDLSKMPF
ncbi:MAG: hypothetical protein ACE3L7_02605 [Candidatus Pristimantibacillus sp.]